MEAEEEEEEEDRSRVVEKWEFGGSEKRENLRSSEGESRWEAGSSRGRGLSEVRRKKRARTDLAWREEREKERQSVNFEVESNSRNRPTTPVRLLLETMSVMIDLD
jgi:hypothetical protein